MWQSPYIFSSDGTPVDADYSYETATIKFQSPSKTPRVRVPAADGSLSETSWPPEVRHVVQKVVRYAIDLGALSFRRPPRQSAEVEGTPFLPLQVRGG